MTSIDYTAALLVADVSDAQQVTAALQTAAHRTLAPFTPLKDPNYKLNHDLLLRAADIIRALTAQTVLDTTTGIWNRRYFDQRLEQEISEAKRYSRPLSLVFCDIDWFKKLNDQFGHQFADSVLEKIAQILSSGRISDIVCRRRTRKRSGGTTSSRHRISCLARPYRTCGYGKLWNLRYGMFEW